MQTLEQFDILRSAEGEALLHLIESQIADGKSELQIATRLRSEYPGEIVAAAMTLIAVRTRAAGKFSRAGEMWLTRAGYEQASSEATSRYRAARYAGFGRVADLCCGIGGDLIGLASVSDVLAVDRDPLHLACTLANAEIYGVAGRVTGLEADVMSIDFAGIDALFIDPARRSDTGRLGAAQTMPPMPWVYGLVDRAANIGVKAAPGIDHESIPAGWEREFIAEGRALKEAMLWSPAMATTPRRATLLPDGLTFVAHPGDPVEVGPPGAFLLDPNPAITRSGLVQDLARTLSAWQIDEEIAFLSSDRPIVTPWARTLRVIASMPWKIREISAALRAHEIGAVDIRRRGLAGDVEAIRKQFKLQGSNRATVAMTRHRDQPWCVIGVEQLA
jgi:SAM-dependent methyltransferase